MNSPNTKSPDNVPDKLPDHLNSAEAAAFLTQCGIKTSPATLAKHRRFGTGPPFARPNNRDVAYPLAAVIAWADARLGKTVQSTAEEAPAKVSA